MDTDGPRETNSTWGTPLHHCQSDSVNALVDDGRRNIDIGVDRPRLSAKTSGLHAAQAEMPAASGARVFLTHMRFLLDFCSC